MPSNIVSLAKYRAARYLTLATGKWCEAVNCINQIHDGDILCLAHLSVIPKSLKEIILVSKYREKTVETTHAVGRAIAIIMKIERIPEIK